MKEFAALRPKTWSYLTDTNGKDKKAKDTRATQRKNKINQL